MFHSPYWLLLLTLLMPLPFSSDRRGQRVPWVTYTLISLNIVAYLFTGPETYNRWGLTPNAPHFTALLTNLFLHVSVAHLLGNMVFLWIFGSHVEEALGREAFLALYLGGGIAADLLHMAIVLQHGANVSVPLVGASGAISAILAPFAIRFYRAQIRLYWLPGALFLRDWGVLEVPAVSGLGLWLLWNIVGGICFLWLPAPAAMAYRWLLPPDKTAYWAHIGGFVFGLVAAELTGLLRAGRQDYLLQDARSAAAQGQEAMALALRKYRAFLDHDPSNAVVRAELARLLAASADPNPGSIESGRQEAALEMLAAIRIFLKRTDLAAAARCAAEAHAFDLTLLLTPRERLRLGGVSESAGDLVTACALLRSLITETPDAPEDEMARLKLAELLRVQDTHAAQALMTSFLEKYPHSQWTQRVREMQITT